MYMEDCHQICTPLNKSMILIVSEKYLPLDPLEILYGLIHNKSKIGLLGVVELVGFSDIEW